MSKFKCDRYVSHCEEISNHLNILIDETLNDIWIGGLRAAHAYLDAATMSLKYVKSDQALKMLIKGQHELEAFTKRSSCEKIIALVKIDISAIICLRIEIALDIRDNFNPSQGDSLRIKAKKEPGRVSIGKQL